MWERIGGFFPAVMKTEEVERPGDINGGGCGCWGSAVCSPGLPLAATPVEPTVQCPLTTS
ncbi:hypothetical protein C1H46_001926 [Malus baccata]|uniref:Uncharacterized protein n=1 Tax=Malus baccata TaxID=106549 RepID=A0A540NNT8_MALBA|nr:hypothetical protein C1H46_001926 [Malus baccata]